MSDLTDKRLSEMLKPGVTLSSIPLQLLSKIKRIPGLMQGREETLRYLVESPPFTMKQCNFFRLCVDALDNPKQRTHVSFEDYAMTDPSGPKWMGGICSVRDQIKDFLPVPHAPEVKQDDKADTWAVSVASMVLTLSSAGDVELNCPDTVASGPLSKLITPLSLSTYELTVPPLLSGKVGVDKQDEKFSEAVYNAVSKMPVPDKNKLVDATYSLMAGLKIKVGTTGVESSKDFEIDWTRRPRAKFPLGVPKTIKTKITFVPRAVKIGKQTSNVALNYFLQSFPPKLLEYFSFFGNPGKVQRMFMRMRPYLEVSAPLDPKESLKKWLVAGGYEYCDSTDLDSPPIEKVSLVKKRYAVGSHPKGKAIYYGEIDFDSSFFSEYTIIMYHPPWKKNMYYVHNKYSDVITKLPSMWKTFPRQFITSDIQFTNVLNSFSSLLCTCFMRGTYNPRPSQYEDLVYPLPEAGKYMTLDPLALGDDPAAAFGSEQVTDTSSMNVFTFGNEGEDSSIQADEDEHEEEEDGQDDEDFEVGHFSEFPSSTEGAFYVPLEDYELSVRKGDRRLEKEETFRLMWAGAQVYVCGLGRMNDEIVNVMMVPVPKPPPSAPIRREQSSRSSSSSTSLSRQGSGTKIHPPPRPSEDEDEIEVQQFVDYTT